MDWNLVQLGRKEMLILSTQSGIRVQDVTPSLPANTPDTGE
ncbi:hypothetical protein [Deinococcus alpinitundrae]|nr:hypothetical protein [Deinococcus alpinitundrae]